jgi:hypothetical protein
MQTDIGIVSLLGIVIIIIPNDPILMTGHPKSIHGQNILTLSLLMSCMYVYIYIYMELLVKPETLTSYIYVDLRLCNAESRLFLFSAQCFNIESMQKVFLCHSCQLPRLPKLQMGFNSAA